jgi:hypothetical protein
MLGGLSRAILVGSTAPDWLGNSSNQVLSMEAANVTLSANVERGSDDAEIDSLRSAVADNARGFYVLRSFYSREEVDEYITYCERFLHSGKVIYNRINTDSMIDYVHPRSHDHEERTFRIYQFFHNHRDDGVGRFLRKAITLRNTIEVAWMDDPIYQAERERLQDYCIVTHYLANVGMLPIHRDYSGPSPSPLIQFWVALSQPGIDYRRGNLILYTPSGNKFRVEDDLGINAGDAVIFDKSLLHEVEVTETGQRGTRGRWTVLIGARAKRDSPIEAARKRLLYDRRVFPTLSAARRILRRMSGEAVQPR